MNFSSFGGQQRSHPPWEIEMVKKQEEEEDEEEEDEDEDEVFLTAEARDVLEHLLEPNSDLRFGASEVRFRVFIRVYLLACELVLALLC